MNAKTRDIATNALSLPEEERLALASELIDSVDGPEDVEWTEAWVEELKRRAQDGPEHFVPWSEVRARLLLHLGKP